MRLYLGVNEDTMYRYAAEGKIPAFKLGNRWRFKRSLVDQWITEMSRGEMEARQKI
jgi:excisionase family DNA binding protein